VSLDVLHPLSWPPVQVVIIVAFGLLLLALKRYRSAILATLVAAAWTCLCAAPAFATWLQQSLQGQYPPRSAASYPTAQAIVVLSGSDFPRSSRRRRADATAAPTTRVGFGLRLYRAGDAPVILLSGGGGGALRMARALHRRGVPASALRTETRSGSTHQNALYSAPILKSEGKQRILLVTSAMDMPRAVATFRHQGLTVVPAPVPYVVDWLGGTQQSWWPQHRALFLTSRCLHEYLGLLAYKLLGWA
jgi:uncharacterized SAM-binding protein YcdF (DUF218 family)